MDDATHDVVQEPAAAVPALTVSAVAHRLGVAPATLRTWDRRYGVGPSEHAAGAHRRYAPVDVARLQVMRRLTLEGVSPADAARAALATTSLPTSGGAPLPDKDGALSRRTSGPGGQVLALPGAGAVVRGLGRAAMALDAERVSEVVRDELAAHGVVHTWEHVLRPVLAAVGQRWATTGEGVEVEHLLSDCITAVLRTRAAEVTSSRSGRPVLLACAPDEQHALPLHALSAGLAERGLLTRTLGAAMPAHALQSAVARTGPALLFVWSQLPGTADAAVLEQIPITRPPTVLLVGGPGWRADSLPARITLAGDLPDALDLVDQALGAA